MHTIAPPARPTRPAGYRPNDGFTIIELLVVVAIIIVLAALLFVGTRSLREAAYVATCSNKLRQIGQGLATHQAEFNRYPSKNDGIAWDRAILPYMGYDGDRNLAGNGPIPRTWTEAAYVAQTFACDSDQATREPGYYKRSYAIVPWTTNWSNGTAFRGWKERPYNIGVPLSAVANPGSAATVVEWHSGIESIANHLGSGAHAYHDRGGPDGDGQDVHGRKQNVLFADGHVQYFEFISNEEFVKKYWPGSIGSTN